MFSFFFHLILPGLCFGQFLYSSGALGLGVVKRVHFGCKTNVLVSLMKSGEEIPFIQKEIVREFLFLWLQFFLRRRALAFHRWFFFCLVIRENWTKIRYKGHKPHRAKKAQHQHANIATPKMQARITVSSSNLHQPCQAVVVFSRHMPWDG